MSRKITYSLKEKALLASLIEQHKDQLNIKKTDSSSNRLKAKAWESICNTYNSYDFPERTTNQLKKCWENIKYRNRKSDTTNQTKDMFLTSEGQTMQNSSESFNERVRSIISDASDSTNSDEWDDTELAEQGSRKVQYIAQSNFKRKLIGETSTRKSSDKKPRREFVVDTETYLRIQKIEESIEQQEQLHQARLEVLQAEKMYWLERRINLRNE